MSDAICCCGGALPLDEAVDADADEDRPLPFALLPAAAVPPIMELSKLCIEGC